MTPGRAADAPLVAVHARGLFLCGVALAGVDLTLVLAPGQELDVHFLREDEESLSTDPSLNPRTSPAMQNCVYLSVLWLGHARFESQSLQFAELANFCREHKVSDSVYHQLTQRLGQILRNERLKRKGLISDDEDDFDTRRGDPQQLIEEQKEIQQILHESDVLKGEFLEKSEIQNELVEREKTSENKRFSSEIADNDELEAEVHQQLKEIGPEEFLRTQLKQLTQSTIQESLRAAREHFLGTLQQNCSDTALYNLLASEAPSIMQDAAEELLMEKHKKEPSNGTKSVSTERALLADSCRACAERAAAEAAVAVDKTAASIPTGDAVIGVAGTATEEAAAAAVVAGTATAIVPAERAADFAAKALVTATPTAPAGQRSAAEPAVASPRTAEGARGSSKKGSGDEDDWTDFEDDYGSVDEIRLSPKTVQGATDSCLALLHGIQNVLLSAQGELNSSANTSEFQRAMQEAELKITNVSSILNEAEEGQEVEKVKSQTFDVAEGGTFDCTDFHKSLNTEIQKHARELSVFRDEAFRLIENWKSADSPPATPEELEFLQELSLLLDSKSEKTEKCGDDAFSLARQLLKFWNAANFPLTPVARRGLLRLQEVLEVPEQKSEGAQRMENSCGGEEGIREVEAALREVRDAFRDVKHVFEVQRCFRDLRECFRDVRRAYRSREPRPRALPPCADAPAAAAAAALAEAVAQAKKRGRTASDVSGSRTPSPAGTPTHSQPKKKQQQCATCKAMVADGTGEGLLGSAEIVTATALTTDPPQTEVSKASHLAATMTSSLGGTSGTTLDQASQTISTGAVLALHLLPDE